MAKIELDDIASGYNLSKINTNFDRIEDELNQKVLYRANPAGNPNAMGNDFDMNGFDILNVGYINANDLQINGQPILDYIEANEGGIIDPEAVNVRRRSYTAPSDGVVTITLVHPYEGDEEDMLVFRNGVAQSPDKFTLSSTTSITFNLPLETGEVVEVLYFNTVVGLEGPEGPVGPAGPQGIEGPQGVGQLFTYVATATSRTAVAFDFVHVTSATTTQTLPATPDVDDEVGFRVGAFTDTVIARNGNTIETLAEDMTVDVPNKIFTLKYTGSTWRIVNE
jgi:hypothetical protein